MLSSPDSHHEGSPPPLCSTAPRALSRPDAPSARHNRLLAPTRPVLRSLPPLGDPVHGWRGQSYHVLGYLR